jgi:hypothetical protein
MAAQIAAFMNDTDRFGVVVVTTAEEMPIQECLELLEDLELRIGRPPELVAVNALYPPAPEKRSSSDPATHLWIDRRTINERELRRLSQSWDGPSAELPLLPIDAGRALVDALARRLEEAMDGE